MMRQDEAIALPDKQSKTVQNLQSARSFCHMGFTWDWHASHGRRKPVQLRYGSHSSLLQSVQPGAENLIQKQQPVV